ncbi:hypothetical protein GMORB2_3550 [Geosmithia morbida]|uniref:Xylanolytic transcriptional activator regulatory domain-containing protein n=1 Tax=Geosmithia morbida TaxID=1094350 RepID=A0A9P4YNU4_9HYPO|nr:uncharacterized protein GMORB2_3550 [Geosmithia morbida]KAF4119862.1 hypothetical protein GMORB2_3550 [Geosmithia morbida]
MRAELTQPTKPAAVAVAAAAGHQQEESERRTDRTDDSISETVPDEADGFDWQEDVNGLADGMAALSVEPKGAGYLGSTAGAFFLRPLLFWLGHSQPTADNLGRPFTDSPKSNAGRGMEASSRLSASMESREVVGRLIDSYFSLYNRTYPFVHEGTFRAQYHEVIARPHNRSWQMLLHTILALGAWCLGDAQSGVDEGLYRRAVSFGEADSLFESANLTFVQALVLLSNLSQKRNKPNTGSNFLGLATRMALSLGLHRELPDWHIGILQREIRRRVWWGLYTFDSGASTTFGRPILLPDKEAMDVRPVLNIADENLTAGTTAVPPESTEPTIYSSLRWQSDFHLHTNHISNHLLSSTGVPAEEALAMDASLDAWSDRLPAYFRLDHELATADPTFLFARCRLWWRVWNLKIVLFRQLLLKRAVERTSRRDALGTLSEAHVKSRDVAVHAASSTIASIHGLSQMGANINRLVAWYSIYFLFHASLIIALAIVGDAESLDLPRWQSDLETVRTIFRITYADNSLAQRCADILDLIVPSNLIMAAGWDGFPLDTGFGDMTNWPADGSDFMSLFGWPDATGPGV